MRSLYYILVLLVVAGKSIQPEIFDAAVSSETLKSMPKKLIQSTSSTLSTRNPVLQSSSAYKHHRPLKMDSSAMRLMHQSTTLQQQVESEQHKIDQSTTLQLNGKNGNRLETIQSIFQNQIKDQEFKDAETIQQTMRQQKTDDVGTKHLPDMMPDPLDEIRKRKRRTGSAYRKKLK
jgi:hypothetical protein